MGNDPVGIVAACSMGRVCVCAQPVYASQPNALPSVRDLLAHDSGRRAELIALHLSTRRDATVCNLLPQLHLWLQW